MLRLAPQLLLVAACSSPAEPEGAAGLAPGSLELTACGGDEISARLECGTLEVFEDRDAASGRRIGLHVTRLRAASPDPFQDPVFFLAGGPGLAAGESIWSPAAQEEYLAGVPDVALRRKLGHALESRDHVYVDVRGTGRSAGLDCMRGLRAGAGWSLREVFETPPFNPGAMARCLEEFKTQADLTKYTTSLAADDIDDVRAALGYESINIHGASYGSRLALEYARRHGRNVRTVTLVGVAPSFGSLVTTLPADVAEVTEQVLSACEVDGPCGEAFPRLREDLATVLEVAATDEVQVTLKNPVSGEFETVEFRQDRILSAIRYLLYGVSLQAQLPLVIHLAAQGDFHPLAQSALHSAATIDALFYEGYFASVKCSEELGLVDQERAARIAEGTMMGRARLDPETEICKRWPKAPLPSDFHQPVRSELPFLLINGDRDPATPARLAREAIKHLPKGLYVELANRAHTLLPDDSCDLEIQVDFLHAGTVEGLDTACAAELVLPPFVTQREALDAHFLTFYALEDDMPASTVSAQTSAAR